MKIVILGGSGQLGQSFARIAPDYEWAEMTFADLPQTDITDPRSVEDALVGADAVVNCAAWTAVDAAENHPDEAMHINCDGARVVAKIAARLGVALVHISTDYVFDGNGRTPITEDAPTEPLGVYGMTKLAGERAVAESGGRTAIVRTAWLYSEFGSNFVKTMLRVGCERGEVRVVDDQIGSPTYAVDLAQAVLHLIYIGIDEGCEIYHYCNSGATSWFGFAEAIFREAKEKVSVIPISTAEYPTLARRPEYSVLNTSKIAALGIKIPHWEEALRLCITQNNSQLNK